MRIDEEKLVQFINCLNIPLVFINGCFGTPKERLKEKFIELHFNVLELKQDSPKNREHIENIHDASFGITTIIIGDIPDIEEVKTLFEGMMFSYIYLYPPVETNFRDVLAKKTIPILIHYNRDVQDVTERMNKTIAPLEKSRLLIELTKKLHSWMKKNLEEHLVAFNKKILITLVKN